jgi:hypothetical protein
VTTFRSDGNDDAWWDRAHDRTDILDLRGWSDWPRNISSELAALEQAGLPATIDSYDTLRLADGRRARIAPATSPRRQPAVNPDDEPELLFLPVVPNRAPARDIVEVARFTPNLLLVVGSGVWVDGRRRSRPDPFARSDVDRFAVFAVARTLPVASGRLDGVAARTGLSIGRVGDALRVLGDAVQHGDIGWEAVDMFALADWAIAAYPGPGGIATNWHHPGTVDEQARLLIDAGLLVSGAWAALTPHPSSTILSQDGDVESVGTRIAFARTMPDMTALGFTLAPPPVDGPASPTFTIVVPEDTTIFATANFPAGGITDSTITAATLAHSRRDGDLINRVRGRIHFMADTYYDLIHNLPD